MSVEDGTCYEHEMSGRWDAGTCGFRMDGGKELFFWTWAGKESSKAMDGDYLMPDPGESATRSTDFAAAKAALAK